MVTLTGHLIASNSGGGIVGAALRFPDGSTVTTDAAGAFRASVLAGGALRVLVSGPVVPREFFLGSGTSRAVSVEAFAAEGFDLDYFRQLARGTVSTGVLQPLRRWTQNPSVYIRTVTEAGGAVPSTLR